VAGGKGFSELN